MIIVKIFWKPYQFKILLLLPQIVRYYSWPAVGEGDVAESYIRACSRGPGGLHSKVPAAWNTARQN